MQYACRIVQGVEAIPSPDWLRHQLEAAGYRSINLLVDIGNYVMHETGQPLHIFDYDKLKTKHLVIRESVDGETLLLLNGDLQELPAGTLLICDGMQPTAIAGIMGGLDSSVTESTHTIVIESAQFHPSSIRKSSKAMGLRSESSARFENDIDPAGVRFALDYAASLFQDICSGRVLKGVAEITKKPYKPRFLTCRLSRINHLLGTQFSVGEVETFLTRLGFTISSDGQNLYQIKVPSWRNDIREEIDIVEEVARLYGYNNIPRTRPKHTSSTIPHSPLFTLSRHLRTSMINQGLQECITCNLLSHNLIDFGFGKETIHVLHAKSEDQSMLRPSLLPGLVGVVQHNQNQGIFDIHAFEIGQIHFREGATFIEKTTLGILLTGDHAPNHWSHSNRHSDFYDLKGTLPAYPFTYKPSHFKTFHPKRQASILLHGAPCGVIGELHPSLSRKLGLRNRLLYAEIGLSPLLEHPSPLIQYKPIPTFPASTRDHTFTMKRSADLKALLANVDAIKSPLLKQVELRSIYLGNDPDKKHVTFRFTYRSDEHTLSFEEVEHAHAAVLKNLD